MAVSDFYTARWPDFICISAHYKYDDDDDDDDEHHYTGLGARLPWLPAYRKVQYNIRKQGCEIKPTMYLYGSVPAILLTRGSLNVLVPRST